MRSESLRLAKNELNRRRENALYTAEQRRAEISAKIPEALPILTRMSQTGMRLSGVVFTHRADAREEIDRIMRENLADQQLLAQLLQENGYSADYLETPYHCPHCGDTGYVKGGAICDCLRQLTTRHNLSAFHAANPMPIPSFAQFSLDYYDDRADGNGPSPRAIMTEILKNCKEYAARFSLSAPSLLLLGDTGLGKTHLSLAIAGELIEKNYNVLYTSAPELFRKLQSEYYGRGDGDADTMQLAITADLLILDDLGAEVESNFVTSSLYNLVNQRLNRGLPTIISSNLTMKELERRYTDRVASRLLTLYKCMKFVGKDVRMLKLRGNR